ncbi:hypothetical protein [Rhodoferax antarcticus]|uniref:hypothetical protein n=1 Tax=Rhodoferax antarcticus TaxID=81479 RepID=UPI00222570D4|nr:hypothetical protein [Rhodoferax antarcticus]MCW2310806.1 hypothetical protein [Rhodoferax antarcticus]
MGLLTSALAEPIVLYDGTESADTTIDTRKGVTVASEPLPVDAEPLRTGTRGTALTRPEPAEKAQRTLPPPPAGPVMPQRTGATPTASPGQTHTPADVSVHSAIKEGVRPVFEKLVESGAVQALHELKSDLGLNKNQWREQDKPDPSVKGPGRWDAPGGQDPAQPPRSAAQAQLDREMASMMREKLIDQITPWLFGLAALLGVGYLARLLYGYVLWKSAKRSKRRSARAQRHALRRTRSSARDATITPSASHAAPEMQE